MGRGLRCFVCQVSVEDFPALADHFYAAASASDASHVMWLNRHITRKKVSRDQLSELLHRYLAERPPLAAWITHVFIDRFLGARPHPFVVALQRPSREVLLGYVLEHQHFLRQWVRSCASVIVKTDREDVVQYEIDNIATEYGGRGPDQPSHYELLLRMGESQGLSREKILATPPLPGTQQALQYWAHLAEEGHWLETVAGMHTLELIASQDVKDAGATVTYFDPRILHDPRVHPAVQAFLREGYEADQGHSAEALALVEKYAGELEMEEAVRTTVLQSMDAFDLYLDARLERAEEYESP